MSLLTTCAGWWFESWPLARGKYLPLRILGALSPQWAKVRGMWLLLHPQDGLQKQILLDGAYEPDVVDILHKYLRPGATFVDVGANIGYFTLIAAQTVGPQGTVHSFEPGPETAERCRQNVARNGLADNVQLHQIALSNQLAQLAFYISSDSGNSSLSGEGLDVKERVTVQTRSGDDVLSDLTRLDLLKMDVEGAELKALYGLRGTLERFRPPVILEVFDELLTHQGASAREVRSYMSELGYNETPLDDKTSLFVNSLAA
jgi:FkbM family methyltransferase